MKPSTTIAAIANLSIRTWPPAGACGALLLSLALLAGCEGPIQTPAIAPTQPAAIDTPPNIRIENSSGQPVLDQSAIKAVESWKFRPGTRNGNPVTTDLRVPVTFEPPTMRPDMCFQLDEQR